MEITRRTAIKYLGGLVLATAGGLILPSEAQAVEFIPGEEYDTIVANRKFSYEGLAINYSAKEGSRNFRIYDSKTNQTYLHNELPSVGIGGPKTQYRVQAGSHNQDSKLVLEFTKEARHGGFRVRDNFNAVTITLTDGTIDITNGIVQTSGKGTINSGTSSALFNNQNVGVASSIGPNNYTGATPLVVVPKGGRYEYHFRRNGEISQKAR